MYHLSSILDKAKEGTADALSDSKTFAVDLFSIKHYDY